MEKPIFDNEYAKKSYDNSVLSALYRQAQNTAELEIYEQQLQNLKEERRLLKEDYQGWLNQHQTEIWQYGNDGLTTEQAQKKIMRKLKDDVDSFNNNHKKWVKEHAASIQTGANKYESLVASIAAGEHFRSMLSDAQSVHIVYQPKSMPDGRGNYDRKGAGPWDKEASKDFYETSGREFLKEISSSPVGQGNYSATEAADLSYQKTEFLQKQTTADSIKGLEHIKDTGIAGAYDLETLGGPDKYGRQVLDQITEWSYAEKVRDKTGKFVDSGVKFGTVIGSTKEQYEEYMRIIDKLENGSPEEVTGRDRVIFHRLKLAGHKSSVFDTFDAKTGVVRYKSFAGAEDVEGELFDTAREGAKRLYELGQKQQKLYVNYNGKKMLGIEAEWFRFLDRVHDNKITLVNHNLSGFDNIMSLMMMSGGIDENGKYRPDAKLLSQGAREYAAQRYAGGMTPEYQVDSLMLERTFGKDHEWTDEEKKIAAEHGLTSNQLEFLQRVNDPTFYERQGAAHLASVDIEAELQYVLNTDRFGIQSTPAGKKSWKIIPDNLSAQEKVSIHGGNTQMFYAAKSINPNEYNVFGFTDEKFGDKIETMDGFKLSEAGVEEELFAQSGVQRGVAYTIGDVRKVTPSEEVRQKMAKFNQYFNAKEMYAITLNPMTNSDPWNIKNSEAYKGASPITYYGTKENIQAMMNDAMYYIAEAKKGAKGQVIWHNTADQKTQEDLQLLRNENGKMVLREDKNLANNLVEESRRNLRNESAARAFRELDANKVQHVMDYIDAMETYVQGNISDPTDEMEANGYRQDFIEQVQKNSEDIEALIDKGDTVRAQQMISDKALPSYHQFFGFGANDDRKVYRNTVDNLLQLERSTRLLRPLYEEALQAAEDRAGKRSGKEFKQYFRMYMTGFIDSAINDFGKGAIGAVPRDVRKYTIHNFTVDMAGFSTGKYNRVDIVESFGLDRFKERTLNVPLGTSGIGLADKIIRFATNNNIDISKVTEAQKLQALMDFKQHLVDTHQVTFANNDERKAFLAEKYTPKKHTVEYAAQHIMQQLKATRKHNYMAGIPDDGIRYDMERFGESDKLVEVEKDFIITDGDGKDWVWTDGIKHEVEYKWDKYGTPHYYRHETKQNFGYTAEQVKKIRKKLDNTIGNISMMDAAVTVDKNGKVVPKERNEGEKKLATHINNILDNIIFDMSDDEYRKALQKDHHISQEAIDGLMEVRKAARRDAANFMTETIKNIRRLGGSFEYDTKNRTFTVIEKNKKTTIRDLMHFNYSNGISYIETGSYKVANVAGFRELGYGENKTLSFATMIAKADSDTSYRFKGAQRAVERGASIGDAIQESINAFNRKLVQVTDVAKMDAEDARAMFLFDAKDAVRYARKAYKEGYLQEIKPEYVKDVFTGEDWINPETGEKEIDKGSIKTFLHKFLSAPEDKYHPLVAESFDKVGYSELTAIMINSEYFMDEMNRYINSAHNKSSGRFKGQGAKKSFLKTLDPSKTKRSQHAMMSFEQTSDFGEEQTAGAKGEFEQMDRALKFDATKARESIEHGDLKGSGVTIGQPIHSEEHWLKMKRAEGLTHEVDSVANVPTLDILTADLHALVNKANLNENDVAERKVAEWLSMASTGEGSAALGIDVADEIFDRRSTTQSIDEKKIMHSDGNRFIDGERYLKEKINIEKVNNGADMKFSYGEGVGIQQGETLATVFGMNDAPKEIEAKENGIAKYGFFTHSGMLVDEKTINETINSSKYKSALLKAQSQTEIEEVFQKIMEENKWAKKLYIHTFEQSGNLKIAGMMSEKGMHRLMGFKLGEIDSEVSKVIDALGGEEAVEREGGKVTKRYGALFMKDQFIRKDILKSVIGHENDLAETAFGIMVNTYRKDKLTSAQMRAIVESQFADMQSFYDAMAAERRQFVKIMNEKIFAPAGIKENIQRIAETNEAEKKHVDIHVYSQRFVNEAKAAYEKLDDNAKKKIGDIDKRLEKILSKAVGPVENRDGIFVAKNVSASHNLGIIMDEMDKLSKEMGYEGMYYTADGKDITGQEYYKAKNEAQAKAKELKEAGKADEAKQVEKDFKAQYKERGAFGVGRTFTYDTEVKNEQTGEYEKKTLTKDFEVRNDSILVEPNYDVARSSTDTGKYGKRVKFTHRNLQHMEWMTYDAKTLNKLNNKLKSMDWMGDEVQKRQLALFENRQEGELLYGSLFDNLISKMYASPTEQILARYENGKRVQLSGEEKKIADAERQKLINDGVSEKMIDAILEEVGQTGATRVTRSGITNSAMNVSYGAAMKFNAGRAELDDLKKIGFEVKNIDEILELGAGVNMRGSESWYQSISDHIYGKNIVIDWNSKKMGAAKLFTSEADQYTALPFTAPAFMEDGSIAQADFQAKFATVMHRIDDYHSEMGKMDETARTKAIGLIMESIQDVKQSQAEMTAAKHKVIAKSSEIQFDRGGIMTTNRTQLIGDEKISLLDSMEFNGINLKDSAKHMRREGLMDMQYAIASTGMMNRLYGVDYFEKLGLSGDLLKDVQARTKSYLKTKGTMMLHSRDPQGYLTSSNAAALYFSDSTAGDSFLISAALQEAKKNDNDSDKTSFGIVEGEADISVNGKTTRQKIDYATYQALSGVNGVEVKLTDKTRKMFEDTQSAIVYQSMQINPKFTYDDTHADITASLKDSFSPSTSVEKYRKKLVDNGYSLAEADHALSYASGKTAYSAADHEVLGKRYDSLIVDYMHSKGVNSIQDEGYKAFSKMSGEDQRGALAEFAATNKNYSDQQKTEFGEALRYKMDVDKNIDKIAKDIKKGGAGLANYHVWMYEQVALNSGAYVGADAQDFKVVNTALYEAYLSPKNEKGAGDLEVLDKLNSAYRAVYDAGRTNDSAAIDEASQNLYDTLKGIGLFDRKELHRQLTGLEDTKAESSVVEAAVRNYTDMIKRVDLSGMSKDAFRVGQAANVKLENFLAYNKNSKDPIQLQLELADNVAKRLSGTGIATSYEGAKVREGYQRNIESAVQQSSQSYKQALGEVHQTGPSTAAAHAAAGGIGDIMRGIARSAEHLGGMKGVIAGMAAGITLAGYGSSPAAPASTQAAGAAEAEQEIVGQDDTVAYQGVPQLSDANLNVMRGGPRQGYVVNINASSERGQDAAVSALNNAMQSGAMPMNNSVNIHMNTSYQDKISQLQINQMVANGLMS